MFEYFRTSLYFQTTFAWSVVILNSHNISSVSFTNSERKKEMTGRKRNANVPRNYCKPKLLFIRTYESAGTWVVWFRNESYTLSVRSLEKSMEPEGEWGRMSSEGGWGNERGEKREEKPERRHGGRLSTCVRPFSLETQRHVYIVL